MTPSDTNICPSCGQEIVYSGKGRPRKWCLACAVKERRASLAASQRAYRERNSEKIAASTRDYYLRNRDKLAPRRDEYRERNRERIAAAQRAYAARKRKEAQDVA